MARLRLDLIAIVTLIALPFVMPYPALDRALEYDEADYARASFAGVAANAFDRESTNVLRHFHPPGMQYLTIPSLKILGRDATSFRLPLFLLTMVIPALIYGLLRALFRVGRLPAFAAASLLALFPLHSAIAAEVRHFSLVGITSLLVACTAARALAALSPQPSPDGSGDVGGIHPVWLIAFGFAWVSSALAMEYSVPLLCLFVGALVYVRNPWLKIGLREFRVSTWLVAVIIGMLGLFALLWPAGVMHGPFNFAYYAVFYRDRGHPVEWMGEMTSHPPRWASLWWLLEQLPVATVLFFVAVGFAIYWGWRRRQEPEGVFSLFLLGTFGLGVIQHQMHIRYSYFWVPLAALQLGLVLHHWAQSRGPLRWAPVVVLALLPLVALDPPAPDVSRDLNAAQTEALAVATRDWSPVVVGSERMPILCIGLPEAQAEFYLGGGFRDDRHAVKAITLDSVRGTADSAQWPVAGTQFPVQVDPALRKLVRISGQRGENLLKIVPDSTRDLFRAELAAGIYQYAAVRWPWPGDADEFAAPIAETWRVVSEAEVDGGGRVTLYERP